MTDYPFKTALVALNAQYIHTGLGVRSITAYVKRELNYDITLLEYTINHHERSMLEGLYQSNADLYLFSCYIWNIEIILRLARNLRQLRPAALIGIGGPQAGYQDESYLLDHPQVDFILHGEGEAIVCRLLRLLRNGQSFFACPGLTFRKDAGIISNPPPPPLSMDKLAFAYPDMDALDHRIIYYESMRGCPHMCSYCTSSIERGVRKRSLPLVFTDLFVFLEHMVPQVKWVDRTFNCDPDRALKIWKWLSAHDNGVTNFHFELAGEGLNDEALAFLADVRPGLFQFEVGIQSTHSATLSEIDRPANLPHLFSQIRCLLSPGNIHIHLDLIAGLPYENFECFQKSFNEVYALLPHQFQLGFLKVLPGSKMAKMADSYALVYSHNAPYEVLSTNWLPYEQLVILHGVADMVNTYYNSARYAHIVACLLSFFSDPFSFYQLLSEHFQSAAQGIPVSQIGYYEILYTFMCRQGITITEKMQWLTKYDLLLHEKPRKRPSWVLVDLTQKYRKEIQAFYKNPANIAAYLPEYEQGSSLLIERTSHMEIFPFHPETGVNESFAALFNYKRRDILGRAHTHLFPLQMLTDGYANEINAAKMHE